MSISPASSGYYYRYDYYLKVYDSNNIEKISKRYYSTSSSYSQTYSVSSTQLQPGKYTIKLLDTSTNTVKDTATLKVQTVPSYAYSVSVSDTTINYGSSGSISMSITPASSSYNYRYDYYLKVYDSNNIEKISKRYYSTSSSYSQTYSLSYYELEPGTYTIKLLDTSTNTVKDTATLTVKSLRYDDYTVSVNDAVLTYGEGGYINMDITPYSGYTYNYKYDYYLKVYDTNNLEKITQRYYSTSSSYQESYYVSSTKLSPGFYTIKILNTFDNGLMDSAKLFVADEEFSIYSDVNYYVTDNVIINYTISDMVTGTFSVYLNDKYLKRVNVGSPIELGHLEENDYYVKVVYDGNSNIPSFEDYTNFYVSKYPLDYYMDYDLVAGQSGTIKFIFDEPTTGSISVYFPDLTGQNTFSSNIVNKQASINVPGLKGGYNDYVLTYSGNAQYASKTYNSVYVEYKDSPISVYIPEVTWGQEMNIAPSLPKGATGYLELYIDNDLVNNMSVGKNYKFNAVNGGEHTLKIKYSGDDYFVSNQTTQKFTIKRFDSTVSINNTIMANPSSLIQVTLNKETNGYIKVTIDGRTYSGYVKNGTFTFYADYLYKGSYNAIIDYQGDAKYNPFSIAKEIVSIAKNPNISLKLNNIQINNNIVIKPTVNSTASGSLEIYVDGSYKTSISIGGSYTLNKPSVGKHEVLVKYSGNNYYDMQNVSSTFRVFTRDPIVANDMKVVYGTDKKFQATFYDEYGALLNNTYVQFNVNGTDYPVLTNEFGVATLNVNLPVGNYKVTSISLLDESQVNSLLVFHSVFAQNTVLEYGSYNKFYATFLDETAKPLSKTGIIFVVDGINQPMVMTDVDGIAYLNSTLSMGKHTITSINTITNQQMTNIVHMVSSIDGIMKINDIRNIDFGQKTTMTINMGNSYLNGKVEIRLTNDKSFTRIINLKSSKTITQELSNLPAGKYTAFVTYTGNDDLVLTLNKTFTVSKIDPIIDYEIHDAGYGDAVEIYVKILNLNGTVSFRVDGTTYNSRLVNGSVVRSISGLSKGQHPIDIIFNGDDNYNPLIKSDTVNVYTRLNVNYDSVFIISDDYAEKQYVTITNLVSYEDEPNISVFIDKKEVKITDKYYSDDDYEIEFAPILSEGKHTIEIKQYDSDGNIIGYKSGNFEAINWKHYGGSKFELVTDKSVTYIPNKNITWYVKKVGLKNGYNLYLSTFSHKGITYTLIRGLGYAESHSPIFVQFNPDDYVEYDNSYYKLNNEGIITDYIQSGKYEIVDGNYYKYIGRFSDYDEEYEYTYAVIDGKCYKSNPFFHEAQYGVDYKIINGNYYTLDGERIHVYDNSENYYNIVDGTVYHVEGNSYYARNTITLGNDLLLINRNLYPLIHGDYDSINDKYVKNYVLFDGKLYNVINGSLGSQIELKQSVASYLSVSINSGSAAIRLPNYVTGSVTLEIAGKNYYSHLNKGASTINYPKLSPGVYTYTVKYSGDNKYSSFAKTYSFTVNKVLKPQEKIKLTLEKVTVKKSAKKLVIKATLKINGKAVKGKKLKFKFNKKTYIAKTSKKGVAKVTIKKSILKKLKVGKKIKYTVSYGKITSKKTVKVKK